MIFYVPRYPKTRRYTLGQELEKLTLEILKLLFSVPSSQNRFPRHECRSFFAQNKIGLLNQISVNLDLVKVLLRLAKDTQCLKNKNYLELQTTLQEIGKMLGGWIRATKQNLPD